MLKDVYEYLNFLVVQLLNVNGIVYTIGAFGAIKLAQTVFKSSGAARYFLDFIRFLLCITFRVLFGTVSILINTSGLVVNKVSDLATYSSNLLFGPKTSPKKHSATRKSPKKNTPKKSSTPKKGSTPKKSPVKKLN